MSDTSYYYRVLIYVTLKHQFCLIGKYKNYKHAKMHAKFAARIGKLFEYNSISKIETLNFGHIVDIEYFERG